MLEPARRYGGLVGGMGLLAWAALAAAPHLTGPRGVAGPLLLAVDSPIGAIAILLALLLLGTLVAIAVARLVNTAVGLFVLGWGAGVLAMRFGGPVDLAFQGSPAVLIGFETLLWGAMVAVAAWLVFLLGGRLHDVPDQRPLPRSALEPRALIACAAGLLAIPVAWLLLRNDTKGQALAAAVLGGVATGLFGRIWSPRTQPALLFPAAVIGLGLGQLVAAMRLEGTLGDAFARGLAPRLLLMAPVDAAAGGLAGVAIGLGWARSFVREGRESHEDGMAKPGPMAASGM